MLQLAGHCKKKEACRADSIIEECGKAICCRKLHIFVGTGSVHARLKISQWASPFLPVVQGTPGSAYGSI